MVMTYKQYGEFFPTYLYIKQHTKTGKLYFGKTINHPDRYYGSGLHWKQHIKKHGKEHVVNLWYQLYDNVFDLVADALSMSYAFDIVNNESWLNMKLENGLDGANAGELHHMKSRTGDKHPMYGKVGPMRGKKLTEEQRKKVSLKKKGQKTKPWSEEQRKKREEYNKIHKNPRFGISLTSEQKQKLSDSRTIKYNYKKDNIEILNLGMKQFAKLIGLNYGSMIVYFRKNASYHGWRRING